MLFSLELDEGVKFLQESTVTINTKTYSVWDIVEKVKDKEVVKFKVSDFQHVLNQNRWFEPTEEVTIKEVLEHCERIQAADDKYPVLVYSKKGAELNMLDGLHRLCKKVLSGDHVIYGKIVTDETLEGINHT